MFLTLLRVSVNLKVELGEGLTVKLMESFKFIYIGVYDNESIWKVIDAKISSPLKLHLCGVVEKTTEYSILISHLYFKIQANQMNI